MHQMAGEYINEANGSGRQRLIFIHIINTRYSMPLNELSSQDYSQYLKWEYEKNWAGIGLNKPSITQG